MTYPHTIIINRLTFFAYEFFLFIVFIAVFRVDHLNKTHKLFWKFSFLKRILIFTK